MKVSIITVVFNNEKTVENAITSVLSQTYPGIEYIMIDGGSTDKTNEVIIKYRNKIAKYVSETDKGIYDAMNKGIGLATGDVIGILNSDDLYMDNGVIEDVMDCFIQDQKLDIIYSDLVYVKRNNVEQIVRTWKSKAFYGKYFEHGNVPAHPTLFLRKKVYEQVGLFNLDFSLAADYEFMLRIFKKYNFKSKYIKRVIIKMRLGGATSKNLINRIKQNIEILRSWKINNLTPPFFFIPLRFLKKMLQFVK